MPIYQYRQNNSGGTRVQNDMLDMYVFIEEDTAEFADLRARRYGIYFGGRGDCPCCGDRWSEASEYDKYETLEAVLEEFRELSQYLMYKTLKYYPKGKDTPETYTF